ncbi:MAG: S26 family signal peptidase [Thermoplasmata archaeon]
MPQEEARRLPRSLVNFLRDLAIAFLLVAIVFGALFAFARTWPPMVVVESGSMQHGTSESFIGVVDTGDIVVVQTAPLRQDVATYVNGRAAGYTTYGDYGDVIVFQDPDGPPGRWIIHRAVVFLAWNETANGFDIPTLASLDRGRDWDSNAATPFGLGAGDTVVLMEVGFRQREVTLRIDDFLSDRDLQDCPASCEGYVTMGDNNAPSYDQDLVFQGLLLGRSRGELPWFGLLKLTFAGPFAWGDARAPANSWTALTVSLILLIVVPIALDLGLSLLGSRREKAADNPGEHGKEAPPETDEGPEEGSEEAPPK